MSKSHEELSIFLFFLKHFPMNPTAFLTGCHEIVVMMWIYLKLIAEVRFSEKFSLCIYIKQLECLHNCMKLFRMVQKTKQLAIPSLCSKT